MRLSDEHYRISSSRSPDKSIFRLTLFGDSLLLTSFKFFSAIIGNVLEVRSGRVRMSGRAVRSLGRAWDFSALYVIPLCVGYVHDNWALVTYIAVQATYPTPSMIMCDSNVSETAKFPRAERECAPLMRTGYERK